MAKNSRQRQRKIERKRAQDKAKKRALARRSAGGLAAQLKRATAAPILHCCRTDSAHDKGMSQVLVSRKLKNGKVAFAIFLLDLYCLGVKDVIANIAPQGDYDERVYGKIFRNFEVVTLEPEAARKLVEGAVEYALGFGLSAHPDYRKAKWILGEIDANACSEEFVYGKDGEPLFIPGPNDSPERVNRILGTLERSCGTNGFHVASMHDVLPLDLLEELGDIEGADELTEDDEVATWP